MAPGDGWGYHPGSRLDCGLGHIRARAGGEIDDRTTRDRAGVRAGHGRGVALADRERLDRRRDIELAGRRRRGRPRAGRPGQAGAGGACGAAAADRDLPHREVPSAGGVALPGRVRGAGVGAGGHGADGRRARPPLRRGRSPSRRPAGRAHAGAGVGALLVPARARRRRPLLLRPAGTPAGRGARLHPAAVPRRPGRDPPQRRAAGRSAVRGALPRSRRAAHGRPEGGHPGTARADCA